MGTMIQYKQSDSSAAATRNTPEAVDRARTELSVMQAIAEQLAQLQDDRSRHRVLSWAEEAFGVKEAAPAGGPSAQPIATPAQVAPLTMVPRSAKVAEEDDGLTIGDLKEWFDVPSPPDPDDSCSPADADQPVVSMIHGFVEDFQKLARDWQAS